MQMIILINSFCLYGEKIIIISCHLKNVLFYSTNSQKPQSYSVYYYVIIHEIFTNIEKLEPVTVSVQNLYL